MAARNTTPIFENTPRMAFATISTANTGRDGTGTIGTLITGAAEGTVIRRVWIKATVTTTAGMVRFFLYDGSTYYLLHEVAVTAITASGTVASFESEWAPTDLVLPSASYSLRASTNNAEEFDLTALAADYS